MLFSLIKNEIIIEVKSSFNLFYISFFALSSLILLFFSMPLTFLNDPNILSSFFWIIISFSSIKVVENSFAREKEFGIYDLIYSSPVYGHLFFLSKLLVFTLVLLIIEFLIFLFYSLLNPMISISDLKILFPLFLISNISIISLAIIIYLITSSERIKSFLFPLIFFPLLTPILINSSRIFTNTYIDDNINNLPSIMILLSYSLISVILGVQFFSTLIKK